MTYRTNGTWPTEVGVTSLNHTAGTNRIGQLESVNLTDAKNGR